MSSEKARPDPLRTTNTIPLVDLALRYLKAEQVELVFGVPGGLLHPLLAVCLQPIAV
ncbi:MAG: hypothetical protein V2A73_17595 [Pseudomonadota bacterium]